MEADLLLMKTVKRTPGIHHPSTTHTR